MAFNTALAVLFLMIYSQTVCRADGLRMICDAVNGPSLSRLPIRDPGVIALRKPSKESTGCGASRKTQNHQNQNEFLHKLI